MSKLSCSSHASFGAAWRHPTGSEPDSRTGGLARIALEIQTQLHGTEHQHVANAMRLLADVLDYFNNVDDDDVLRL